MSREELEENDLARQLYAVIDTAIDGIITIDSSGKVEMFNNAASTIFQYNKDEVVGNNIKMLMPPFDRSHHDGYLQRYHETKVPKIIGIGREVEGLRKDGTTFPFRLAVSEVVLNDRVIFTGVIHDLTKIKKSQDEILELNKKLENLVTERTIELEKTVNKLLAINDQLKREVVERKNAEAKLEESQSDLIEALSKEKELNELKSRFVSMASHEFRTPLTSISSSASLIGMYQTDSQQTNREKHINRIKSSVANLTGILNDFLSLSKLEEGQYDIRQDEINIRELSNEIIDELRQLLKKEQKILVNGDGMPSSLVTDRHILKNIIFNLLSNAIKYSEEDVILRMTYQAGLLKIEVKDEGIGIPEEDQKYMFGRFFRAGNVTNIQGTGLGLNIVKRYVEMLSGSISFQSELEKGTTFTLEIPCLEKEKNKIE